MQNCVYTQRLAPAQKSAARTVTKSRRSIVISPRALSAAQVSLQDQLRKAQASTKIVQLVTDNRPLIESTLASTAVQKLAYLPRNHPHPADYENALTELAHAARYNISALNSPVDMLAGFAELDFRCKAVDRLLDIFVLEYEAGHQQLAPNSAKNPAQQQFDTVSWGWADNSDMACKNLVTTAWAFGRLLQTCDSGMLNFMDSVAAELSKKLHNNNLKEAFTPDDLADTADAFANVLTTYQANDEPDATAHKTRNVGALMDTIAVDVRHQLSNKHSMRAPFVPSNLVKLLSSYARMQHISGPTSSMLDAAAGFVVRRMTAGHLNAVTKLSDLSHLLQAYAALRHSTVVMPELLTAASNQLRKQLATESLRQTPTQHSKQIDLEDEPFFSSWGSSVEPVHLISTLKAYKDLGFHPSEGLLTAAEPFLCCLQAPLQLQSALDLVSLVEAFSWRPGSLVLQQIATSLLTSAAQCDAKGLADVTRALAQLQNAGYMISDSELQCITAHKKQLASLQ